MNQTAVGIRDVAYDTDTHFGAGGSAKIIIGQPDKSGYNRLIIKSGKKKATLPYKNGEYIIDEKPDCLGDERCFCPDNSGDGESGTPSKDNGLSEY